MAQVFITCANVAKKKNDYYLPTQPIQFSHSNKYYSGYYHTKLEPVCP